MGFYDVDNQAVTLNTFGHLIPNGTPLDGNPATPDAYTALDFKEFLELEIIVGEVKSFEENNGKLDFGEGRGRAIINFLGIEKTAVGSLVPVFVNCQDGILTPLSYFFDGKRYPIIVNKKKSEVLLGGDLA